MLDVLLSYRMGKWGYFDKKKSEIFEQASRSDGRDYNCGCVHFGVGTQI